MMRVLERAAPESPLLGGHVWQTRALFCAVALAAWAAVAMAVVPWVIRSAYREQSLPVLNALIEGRSIYPVDFYLQMWLAFAARATAAVIAGVSTVLVVRQPWFFSRFVGPATPGTLGAIRMLTCAVLLITTSWESLASIPLLPMSMRRPAGLIDLLLSLPIGSTLVSARVLSGLQLTTEALLLLAMVGWMTRVVVPLAAAAHFLSLGLLIEYSFFWHQGLVPLYLLAVLSFLPCGDGWSVDRLLRVYRGEQVSSEPRPIYGWGRYLCWVVVVLPYVQSGISKLRIGGTAWWSAVNMRSMLYLDTLSPREYDWHFSLGLTSAPNALFVTLGIATIILEAGYVVVLFSRSARQVFPWVIAGMHAGIFLLQRILFLDLIALQLIFGDFAWLRRTARHWIAGSSGAIAVWYDGACGGCTRTVRLVQALDIFGAVSLHDFRAWDFGKSGNDVARPPASLAALEHSMHVVRSGNTFTGFAGYRTLARALPLVWPILPLLFLPGVALLGERVYARHARHRAPLTCDWRPRQFPALTGSRPRRGPALRTRFALTIGMAVALSTGCWLMRIEYFPLTAWHLYAPADTSGVVTYLRVFGRDASGQLVPTRLEDGIGAMALDGRYMAALGQCFDRPPQRAVCEDYLTANGRAVNARRRAGAQLAGYQIEKWTWDFASNPTDPSHGRRADAIVVPLSDGSSSPLANSVPLSVVHR